MQVVGIRRVGARVEIIEAGEPRSLAGGEVLLEVRAAGVGNWDEFVHTGGWDVGAKPPMALGVEAAGTVLAVGQAVGDWAPGDAVMTHPVPLRDQRTWAPRLIAPAGLLARNPPRVSREVAAAFPVPALTAEQVLGDALNIRAGEQLLVHGAGGVNGAIKNGPTRHGAVRPARSGRWPTAGGWRPSPQTRPARTFCTPSASSTMPISKILPSGSSGQRSAAS
jgi:NADPH:quinone reductase-like Zn-dependent oxidoreductase